MTEWYKNLTENQRTIVNRLSGGMNLGNPEVCENWVMFLGIIADKYHIQQEIIIKCRRILVEKQ